jgi:hypothetical protein
MPAAGGHHRRVIPVESTTSSIVERFIVSGSFSIPPFPAFNQRSDGTSFGMILTLFLTPFIRLFRACIWE